MESIFERTQTNYGKILVLRFLFLLDVILSITVLLETMFRHLEFLRMVH